MKFIKSVSVERRFFTVLLMIVFIYLAGYFFSFLITAADILTAVLLLVSVSEIVFLSAERKIIDITRFSDAKLSNGEENEIYLMIKSRFVFTLDVVIVDEVPFQFQKRDLHIRVKLSPKSERKAVYHVSPKSRGEYHFGNINARCRIFAGLVARKITFQSAEMLPVYPSIIAMKKFGFYAASNRLETLGLKKIRRTGYSYEFDQIRRFTAGDDIRKINWKATSKSRYPMVNTFREEKSQDIYSIIDMGRAMQLPFCGMTLLDYAINSSLVLSNTAVLKNDNSGIITFAEDVFSFLPASKNRPVMNRILETLYNRSTDFCEPDYEKLYLHVQKFIFKRSLLVFFSNFETLYSLERNMKYLQLLSKKHHVVVVIFQNSEVEDYTMQYASGVREVYVKTMAEKYLHEKEMIARKLGRNNIQAVLTRPHELTPDVINKYIEIKMRGLM